MATINVSNSSQLSSALATASGGDTIVLSNGYYGDLTINTDFASKVTLQAANDLGASFGAVKITGSNVTLDGFAINGRFTIENADHVELVNSLGTSWNEVLYSSNVVIEGNEFTGTLNFDNVTGFRIANNYIHEIANDLLRVIGGSSDGVIENNTLWDQIPIRYPDGTTTHTDALQMFSNAGGTPHDIVIRGNYIYDDPATGDSGNLWGQGIFLGGPTGGYRNITIEENIVDTGSPNAIYISVGIEGNVIRNNTVLGSGTIAALSGDSSGTVIYDNVVKKITAENGAVAGDNYFYTNASDVFQNGGNGSSWEGFLPKAGSPIDFGSGYGALGRLAELSGTSIDSVSLSNTNEGPNPDPQPQPDLDPAEGTVFSLPGELNIASAGDAFEMRHSPELEISAGTVAFSFTADDLVGLQGLVAKDASGYVGGGHHFAVYLEGNTLMVRLQDAASEAYLSLDGIEAGTTYAVAVTFGPDGSELSVNGEQVSTTDLVMDWTQNQQHLQWGGLGWASADQAAGYVANFQGTISDATIFDTALTTVQLAERNIRFEEFSGLQVDGVGAFVETYGGAQDKGFADVTADGTELTLTDNAWKKVAVNKQITADTVLHFEFKSDVEGEIHGIGFDTDNTLSEEWLFQLDGTQAWGLQDAAGQYTTGSDWQSYAIRVGDYFTGTFDHLVFAMDDDAGVSADSAFRNIRFEEFSGLKVDGVGAFVETYGGAQDKGVADVTADGTELTLTDNAWKKVAVNKQITADTVLHFEFKSDVEGETHGIGFDTDNTLSEEWLFQLDGTQAWGLQDAAGQYTTGSDWQSYAIRVGDYFTGTFDHLVFAMDDDAGVSADSAFRNIRFEEFSGLKVDGVGAFVETYGGAQDKGVADVTADGTELTLTDNAWKKVAVNKQITADTVLHFEFKSDVEGETHGIGFDTDNTLSEEWLFQLDGTQAWGLQDAAGQYTTGSDWQSYAIRVGDYFTGTFDHLVFAMDDDAGVSADSAFRNIRFEEFSGLKVDGVGAFVETYGGAQDKGVADVTADGTELTLTDNAWKKVAVNKEITADTVLHFEFKSDIEGEIHGIGFDTDNTLSEEWLFQLDGTQAWGLQDAAGQYTTGSDWQSYAIRVGDYFTGTFDNLVFVMDDDLGVGADSAFRNIEFI